MTTRAADGLDDVLILLRDRIAEAEVAGFDETGLRVAGSLHWVHCARTDIGGRSNTWRRSRPTSGASVTSAPQPTVRADPGCPGRGRGGIDDAGVLARFRGVAVHDAWAPYDTYTDVDHQLCCAQDPPRVAGRRRHRITRESVVLGRPGRRRARGDATAVAEASADADALSTQVQLYHSAAQIGITDTAARSDTVMKKHNALARRLLDHRRQARQASCPPPTASRRGV